MFEWINYLEIWYKIILWVLAAVAVMLLSWSGINLNKRVFKVIQEKHSGIHLAFFEKINSV